MSVKRLVNHHSSIKPDPGKKNRQDVVFPSLNQVLIKGYIFELHEEFLASYCG